MINSYELNKFLSKIHKSLRLYDVGEYISDGHYDIWFVGRKDEMLKFTIKPEENLNELDLIIFYNDIDVIIHGINVYNNTTIMEKQVTNLGRFFEHYSRYGHFFENKSKTIKYLYYKKLLKKCEISPEAQEYIDKYPECFI